MTQTSLRFLLTRYHQPLSSRLETNKFELRGRTPEQALAIVRGRLAAVPGNAPAQTLFPFDSEELLKTFHLGLYSPWRVITLANQRLHQILNEEPLPRYHRCRSCRKRSPAGIRSLCGISSAITPTAITCAGL